MKKTVLAAVLVLGAVLLAVVLAAGDSVAPQSPGFEGREAATETAGAEAEATGIAQRRPIDLESRKSVPAESGYYGASVGSSFTYTFKSLRSFRMATRNRGDQVGAFAAQGRLEMVVVARRAEEVLVRLVLADLELEGQAGHSRTGRDLTSLAAELSAHPVLLRMGEDGRHLAFRFPQGMGPEARITGRWPRG